MIVAVALGLALAIQAFIVKPYEIPSASMEPTLQIDQRVLVDRIGTHFSSPTVGDIVVFHPPGSARPAPTPTRARTRHGEAAPQAVRRRRRRTESSQTYIKRVVGLPGRPPLDPRRPRATATASARPTPTPCPASAPASAISRPRSSFPKGDYYMMGDNRPDSLDSRFWGPVPKAGSSARRSSPTGPPTGSASCRDHRLASRPRHARAGASRRG